MQFIQSKKKQTNLSQKYLISCAGIAQRTFTEWQKNLFAIRVLENNFPQSHHLTDLEREKIISFYLMNSSEGYRRCTYMMMDQDIVYTSPTTVYRVLDNADVMNRFKGKPSKKGTGFHQPKKIHEHWHSDITNVAIGDTIYFLISILDGYSRKIIAWDLRDRMKARDVGFVFQKAYEAYPDAEPRVITDNGKQYKCKEFKAFVKRNNYTQAFTSPYYPQSNGKQERFHLTIKSECLRIKCPLTKEDAKKLIVEYIDHYNNNRLHSAIGYICPEDKFNGREDAIWKHRDEKLKQRRTERKQEYIKSSENLFSEEQKKKKTDNDEVKYRAV